MIVLDTNIISEPSQKFPSKNVINWMNARSSRELHLCAPVLAELMFGAGLFEAKHGSKYYYDVIDKIQLSIATGVFLSFDERSARIWGAIKVQDKKLDYTRPQFDSIIAAICIANGAILATRNTKDFEGLDVKLINPFEDV